MLLWGHSQTHETVQVMLLHKALCQKILKINKDSVQRSHTTHVPKALLLSAL